MSAPPEARAEDCPAGADAAPVQPTLEEVSLQSQPLVEEEISSQSHAIGRHAAADGLRSLNADAAPFQPLMVEASTPGPPVRQHPRAGPCLFYYDDCDEWMQASLRATVDPRHVMHDGHVHWQNDICVQDYSGDKGEEEGDKGEENDDIDIEAELLQATTEGLSVIQRDALEILGDPLGCVRHFFELIISSEKKGCGDDLVEIRAASCFKHVDRLLRTHVQLPAAAVEDLSQLRNHLQDIVVLSCSRGLDQKDLHGRGLPQKLRVRLEAALGPTALTNLHWLSLLGNSKQHMFMNGVSWGHRRSRRTRNRADCVGSSSHAAEHEGDPLLMNGEMAAPDAAKVPTPMMNGVIFFL